MMRLSVLTVLLAFTGCSAVVVDGSRAGSESTSARPSSPSVRPHAIVLASVPSAITQAVTDLTALGLSVIDPARVEEAFERQHIRPARVPEEQVDPMKVGRQLGADVIVFVEVAAGRRPAYCDTPPCTSVYAPFVSARAFSTETGHILWSGRAHSNTTEARLDAEIMVLTHEAISHGAVDWSPRSVLKR